MSIASNIRRTARSRKAHKPNGDRTTLHYIKYVPVYVRNTKGAFGRP